MATPQDGGNYADISWATVAKPVRRGVSYQDYWLKNCEPEKPPMTRADRISDAILRETRTITLTGRIIGIVNGPGKRIDITLRLHPDDDVTVHKPD